MSINGKKPTSIPKGMDDRVMGCLIGQFIGDALGNRYEFGSEKKNAKQIEKDMIDEHLPILGGVPFGLVKGQVTDDTELAMALARSILGTGQFDIQDIAKSYSVWFRSPPFDIGITTRNAFAGTKPSQDPSEIYERMVSNSMNNNMDSLSNGCLMRISPLAIAGSQWDEDVLQEVAKLDCALTNPNPIALDSVSVYVTAIRTAILTGDKQTTYKAACKAATNGVIKQILLAAKESPDPVAIWPRGITDIKPGQKPQTFAATDSQFMGYLGIALQNTFYELLNGNNFETSLVNIISRGGDTDTNGCIAGALLGAVYGYETVPIDWSETVINAETGHRVDEYQYVKSDDLLEVALGLLYVKEPVIDDDDVEQLRNRGDGLSVDYLISTDRLD